MLHAIEIHSEVLMSDMLAHSVWQGHLQKQGFSYDSSLQHEQQLTPTSV
jgi:hypothetical protein